MVANSANLHAQLINTEDGYHLWSERYDRDMQDVFAVQDEIARSVTETLKVKLLGKPDAPMVTRPTDNLGAYNLCLKGRHFIWKMTSAAHEKSFECFNEALAVEPTYAQAHAGIALTHVIGAALSLAHPRQAIPMAKEAALKALAIDETVADAHTALGMALHFHNWDWSGAMREYQRALTLTPGDTFARTLLAMIFGGQGRADEAVAEARNAVERDPLHVHTRRMLAMTLWAARRFDDAIVEADAGLELEPSYHLFYWDLGNALLGLGRVDDEAVAAFRQATVLAPSDPVSLGFLGWVLGLAGQRHEASTIRTELERQRSQRHVTVWLSAIVHLGLGEHEQAISWLHRAADDHDGAILTYSNVWFAFDPLRADPRFHAFLRRINLPEKLPPS